MPRPNRPAALVTTAVLLGVGILYGICLPHTVQELDTGEMVANSWKLAIAHPPGAPLFILAQYLVTHVLVFDTVFWRAALFNACCAVATLHALTRLDEDPNAQWLPAVGLVLPLGLSQVFWAYAVRPDVFAMHACFTAWIGVAYLRGAPTARRALVLAVLLAAGACVQQTIVFALPLLAHALWENRQWRVCFAAGSVGAVIVAVGYGSLLAMHPDAIESWGYVHTVGDVVRHMLRTDYGTWRLDGHGEAAPWGHNLALLAAALGQSMPVSVGLVATLLGSWALRHRAVNAREAVLLGTLGVYIVVFFALANTRNPAIVERFFIFAYVLLTMGAIRAWNSLQLPRRLQGILVAGAVLISLSQLPQLFVRNDLSHDTVIEDYAMNLLRMVDTRSERQAAIVVEGDSRGYALRYAQSVLEFRPDVLILNTGNLFGGQFRKKLQRTHSDFVYGDGWNEGPKRRSIAAHVMEPNRGRYDFYFARDATIAGYRTTYLGLGRKLAPGLGEAVDLASVTSLVKRSAPSPFPSVQYDERKALYSEYAYVYLKQARLAHDPNQAIAAYGAARDVVPYCFVALEGLCALRSATPKECAAEVNTLRMEEFDYY